MAKSSSCAPPFDNPMIVDDQDLVGISDRAEPVGDHKGSAAFHETEQCLLQLDFSACVDAAGCLVEDEDARVCE